MKKIISRCLSFFRKNSTKVFTEKKIIRQQIRELKLLISEAQKYQEADVVFSRIEAFPEFKTAKNILLYWSTADELPTHDIVEKWSLEKQIILPTVNGEDLVLKRYNSKDRMRSGGLGIEEPDTSEVYTGNVDLIIVPGIAFDKKKNRLGRGKGFYDRFFNMKDNCMKIGVGFEFQLLAEVPSTKMDIRMDKIVTCSEIIE